MARIALGDDLDGLITRFEDLVVRVLRRVAAAAARLLGGTAASVPAGHVSVDDLGVIRTQWVTHLDAEVLPGLGAAYRTAAVHVADRLAYYGHDVAALTAPDAAAFLAAARNRLVGVGDHLWEAARDELVAGLQAGEDARQLAVRVRDAAGVSEVRARMIARTEVAGAANAATLAQVRVLGDPTAVKEWLATPGPAGVGCDERTRPTHCTADGQRVRIGERFVVGEALLDHPGDPTGPADEVVGCRCDLAIDLDDETLTAAASDTEFHLPGRHDQMTHAGNRAGRALGAALSKLVPDDQDDDALSLDGDRYFDWSSVDGGIRTMEIGGDGGEVVSMGMEDADLQQFGTALSVTLLRNLETPPAPDDRQSTLLAALMHAGLHGGAVFGDSEDIRDTGRYVDWSSRDGDGNYLFEAGANGDTASMRLAPDELAQLHAQVVRTLLGAHGIPLAASFHLPGRHDQSKHGHRYNRPGDKTSGLLPKKTTATLDAVAAQRRRLVEAKPAKKLPPDVNPKVDLPEAQAGGLNAMGRLEAAMRATYTYTDPGTGLSTDVRNVDFADDGRAVVRVGVLDRNGDPVGEAVRSWSLTPDGGIEAGHDLFYLDPDVQGGGFGARFNASAEDAYREADVGAVKLDADIDVGGYAWAVQGYDFADPRAMEAIANRFAGRGSTPEQRAQVDALAARSTPEHFAAGTHATPYEWAMLDRANAQVEHGWDGEDRLMWFGKSVMLGSFWAGVKKLEPAPVTAATAPPHLSLHEVAVDALAYANAVADDIPVVPRDADPNVAKSDYSLHHHLISAPPDVERALLELANERLGEAPLTAAADLEGPRMAQPTAPVAETPDTAAQQPEHTGAMVALIPAEEELARLAVDGGEPAGDLHCTLMFLGEAADIPDDVRTAVVNAVRAYVDGWPPVDADGFAVSLFNPPGMERSDGRQRDTCVVLGLSGDELDLMHEVVEDAVADAVDGSGWVPPEQHMPWIPHVTLAYPDGMDMAALGRMVADLADRVGPVTFDRVRVAFGGQVVDIPLDGAPPTAEDGMAGPMAAAAAFQSHMPLKLQQYWIRKIAPWGHGSFDRCVRQIRKYVRDPEGTCANLHHEATGKWPGEKNHSSSSADFDSAPEAAMTMPMPMPQHQGKCPDGQHEMPDGSCMDDEPMAAAEPAEHFHAIMHVEGVSTGMRTFTPGALTWREPPFAFHWQRSSSAHNGQPETIQVGSVTRAARDADNNAVVHGWGRLDLGSAEGLEYARKLAEGWERWVSIGLDESLQAADVEYVWPAGEDGEEAGGLEMLFGEPEQIIFHAGRIAELSGVSIPAQQEATIEPTQALLDELAALGVLVASAVGSHSTDTADGTWDKGVNEKRLPSPLPVATARKMYAVIDTSRVEDGKVPKDACTFPHHMVSADGTPGAANMTACSAIIGSVHGSRGTEPSVSDEERRGAYNHARKHLIDGGREPDSIPDFDAGPTVVTAAGYTITIPDLPPAAWFDEPADDDLPPFGVIEVDDQGRLIGRLAPRNLDGTGNHRSFPGRNVKVPMGNVDYSGWMNKRWPVAEGHKIYVGVITMDCGHASTNPGDWSYHNRREHYDNSCSVAAHARIYEKPGLGPVIAGAIAPWLDSEAVGRLMSCDLSGDWPPHPDKPGWLDFTAALAVPVGGFPNRVRIHARDGVMVASAVPVRLVAADADATPEPDGPDLRPALELIARGIGRDTTTRLADLHHRVHAGRG